MLCIGWWNDGYNVLFCCLIFILVEFVSMIYFKVWYEEKYIEVNESVLVEVCNDKNLKFNVYKYDMGDGSLFVIID